MPEPFIYHICSREEWYLDISEESYYPLAFKEENFVHCSTARQLLPTVNRIFADRQEILVLKLDRTLIKDRIIDENLSGGEELYPHIYGPIPRSAVVDMSQYYSLPEGGFDFEIQ